MSNAHHDHAVGEDDPGRLSKLRKQMLQSGAVVKQRYQGSSAENIWRRLYAMDFINQAMQFAGLLFLAFLPFLIVISALAGFDAASGIARHLGLSQQATNLVYRLLPGSDHRRLALPERDLS